MRCRQNCGGGNATVEMPEQNQQIAEVENAGISEDRLKNAGVENAAPDCRGRKRGT